MRLIDADKLKEWVHGVNHTMEFSPHAKTYSESDVFYMIDNQATVDAVPRGRWERLGLANSLWECSHCGKVHYAKDDFCPYCGACMDEETDDA